MNTTTLPAQITEFAAAVRAALGDLPADEVDELTDGLEADLAEAYAEDLARELPDPVSYAAELRGAAGLPTPGPRRGRIASINAQIAGVGADVHRSLRANPATSAALDVLVTLRPAWWVARAWAAFQCFGAFFGFEGDLLPADLVQWVLMLSLVTGSVLLGQRTWPTAGRVLIAAGNVFAVFVLLFALPEVPTKGDLGDAWDRSDYAYDTGMYDQGGGDGTGVWLNGNEVTNVFAYDARGQALSGVQLFDQDGNPLTTSVPGGNGCLEKVAGTEECATPGAWVPTVLETGAQAWNVYPMQMAESSFDEPTTPLEGAVPQDRPAPFLKVPALLSSVQADAAAAREAKDAKDAKKPR